MIKIFKFVRKLKGVQYGFSFNRDPDTGTLETATGGDKGSASITCFCPVSAGDEIKLAIENVNAGNDATIYDINVNLVRVGN